MQADPGNLVDADVSCSDTRSIARGVLLTVAYIAVAAWPLSIGVARPGITGYERCLLPDHIYGRAYRPYVKRQLVPLVVRVGTDVMPEVWKERMRLCFERFRLEARLRWDPAYAPEFVLTLVVMYVSLLGFLVALRKLLLLCLELSPGWAHGVVLGVAIGLPVTFAGQLYIYDFTQLFVFTVALVLMIRRYWWAYYPVLALACINKETSILLIVVFILWEGRDIFRRWHWIHAAVQLGLALTILLSLAWIFRNNPGGDVEFHLWRNLAMPFTPLAWMRLAVLGMVVVLSLRRITEAPRFFRSGFVATLPPLLLAMLFFGYIDELRNVYEALPFVVGLIVLTLGWRWGVRARNTGTRGVGPAAGRPLVVNGPEAQVWGRGVS